MGLPTIQVDLNEIIGDETDARDAIINAAAASIATQLGRDIAKALMDEVRTKIAQTVDKTLADALNATLTETDVYGHRRPGGKVFTLNEVVLNNVKAIMEERVGENGCKPTYSSDATMTRLEWNARKTAEKYVKEELQKEIDAAKAMVAKVVKDRIVSVVGDAVASVLK